MRVAVPITLSADQRATLQRWARGRTTPARRVRRAKIVLPAAEGRENRAIAAEPGIERTIVSRWRKRFAGRGLAGIEKDAPRGGRGVFRNVKELVATSDDYVVKHNENPRSSTWIAKAEMILEKVRQVRAVLDKMQTA